MKIAIYGLGRMGKQIATKLITSPGFEVIVHNRSKEPINELAGLGAIPAFTLEEMVNAFNDQRPIIWLMLPYEVVDSKLANLIPLLPPGSLVIDGGNSNFNDTKRRNQKLTEINLNYMDIGVSGGVWGIKNGFSMMVGSDNLDNYKQLEKVLAVLSSPNGAYDYFGPSGSGHFVKMVHNGIEYGMMESLAEGYRLLKEGPFENIDLTKVAKIYQKGSVIKSWLNSLLVDIIQENPNLSGINGVVAQSGEAKWTIDTAKQNGIDLPIIEKSLKVRLDSEKGKINYSTKLLSAMRNKFGGHNLNN
ncbi:MAG: decarboxylating 6-phosphogluconate dehydrogenase [Patescibacteria group bacterium]|jgi:6-phosphogluconate dehydrogenase|nr:decarboxylating 6-phosphogluconate dehydrogenase [Patescibacteria group bacterium]